MRYAAIALALVALSPAPAAAQGPVLAHTKEPILRLEAGGPTSAVTALAFSPDGKKLYAAGFDKVVRVWELNERTKQFEASRTTYRVPIGPGNNGALNAMALSPDGKWIAVGGLGMYRGHPGFQRGQIVSPAALSPFMWQDRGTIFVFRTEQPGMALALRGHNGPVQALTFLQQPANQRPILVSAGRDWLPNDERYEGSVRIWDVEAQSELNRLWALPDPTGRLPALTARQDENQTRVGIVWDDPFPNNAFGLQLWLPELGKSPDFAKLWGRHADDTSYGNTVAFLADGKEVFTTALYARDQTKIGTLQRWHITDEGGPTLDNDVARFYNDKKDYPIPRALALVSQRGDRVIDHAAVIVRLFPSEEYKLHIVPIGGVKEPILIDKGVSLWRQGRRPLLAAAPGGSHLAVAGANDHSIRIFALQDLFQNKGKTPQVLQSVGSAVEKAVFVSRVKDGKQQIGLALTEGAEADAVGNLVFDFSARRLTRDANGWKLDSPAMQGWKIEAVPEVGPPQLRVAKPNAAKNDEVLVKLPANYTLRDFALLPPRAPLNVPILAIAALEGIEPRLLLYHGGNGDYLCNMNGHQGPIRSVAFSGDGRLLVSAADDQTVCVWSLFNFEQLIGKKGRVRGVIVHKNATLPALHARTVGLLGSVFAPAPVLAASTLYRGSIDAAGKLAVTRIDADSPALGILEKNDVIEGLVINGVFRVTPTPLELYDELLPHPPGTMAVLRLAGTGGVKGRDVNVPMSQAILERTPLLTLFVMRADKAQDREWIAWNPLGPYDSSSPRAARVLGWHRNTGNLAKPAEFFPAEDQRGEERREGLLRHVIGRGSLAPALDDWRREKNAKAIPPPEMTLGVDDMQGGGVVQAAVGTVRLRVEGLPADVKSIVEWRLDDGAWQQFAVPPVRREAAEDYEQAGVLWQKAEHVLRARVRVEGAVPQEFTRQVAIHFQAKGAPPVAGPALPRTEIAANPPGPMFDDEGKEAPEVRLTGTLIAAAGTALKDAKLVATVLRNGKEFPAQIAAGGDAWDAMVRLEPGPNRLQVKLKNGGHEAIAGELQLFYLRPPRNIRADVPAETKEEALDLVAYVDSAVPLIKQQVRATLNRKPLILAGLEKKEGTKWALQFKPQLQVGSNEIVVDVSNAEGICREPGVWNIQRQANLPPPPVVAFLEPVATSLPSDAGLRVSRPDLTVKVRARSAVAPLTLTLMTSREGAKPVPVKLVLGEPVKLGNEFELTGAVTLSLLPGITSLSLEAENLSGATALPPLLINYIPPPLRVVLTGLEAVGGKARLGIQDGSDGKLRAEPAERARLWLHGKLVWEHPVAEQLRRSEVVAVYVNGAQQVRDPLDPVADATSLERAFKAEIVLDRPDGNEIELEFPGFRIEENANPNLLVSCKKPETERWLHVQVISPAETNDKLLVDSILTTLNGSGYVPAKHEFTRPGFARARLYSPLTEDIDDDVIGHRLHEIRRFIAKRAEDGWPNDVLLVYYVGGEAVDAAGKTATLTYGTSRRPLITRARLERAFAGMIGVKVLLLDVTRPDDGKVPDLTRTQQEVSRWLDPPARHAWMRSAWAGAEPPAEARLLTALGEAMPKAANLRNVVDEVERRGRQLSNRYHTLRLDWYLPAPLAALPLGGGQ